MSVLADDGSASMGQVAAVIGIGRTTLYRHFTDRETMVAEVARRGARMYVRALAEARPAEGDGLAAIARICEQLFSVPDVLTLVFADSPIITDEIFAEVEAENRVERGSSGTGEDPLVAVILRGQEDGSIIAEVPAGWAAGYVYLTIGAGHVFALSQGSEPAARAEAVALTERAIARTLGTD